MAVDFFKKIFKEGNDIYYFNRWDAVFRFSKQDNGELALMDEREKIQVMLDEQGQRDFALIIKNYILKKEKVSGQKSIEQILMDTFQEGVYDKILGKKYLVYDIETVGSLEDLKHMKFVLGYAMQPNEQHKMTYEYVDQNGLEEFVQKMIDFDGYIVGFNNIWFDNPVCIYNVGRSEEELALLNEKSIDLYVLIQALSGKRMGLNKVSEALVGVSKTLESWAETEILYQKFLETGDESHMEILKQYCKNDVRMTALVFLYFMHFKKLFMEDDEIFFGLEDIIARSNRESIKEENKEGREQNIFA